jgi:hypothetical protein
MTVGPTATQLHNRTLSEEEPRTAAGVPAPSGRARAEGPSSSESVCAHQYWKTTTGLVCVKCQQPYEFPSAAA